MGEEQVGRHGPGQRHLNIELPANLEAIYANFAVITHTPSEVIIDYARLLPGNPKGKVHARVVMTPMNAKLLHRALGENLGKFEEQHGEIKVAQEQFDDPTPLGFKK